MADQRWKWRAVSCFFACLGVLWIFGTDTIFVLWRSMLSVFLFLAVTTLLMSYLYPRLKKLVVPYYRQWFPEKEKTGVDYRDQRRRAAGLLQETHDVKAASFFERVLQPRQEARLRLKDKELEHSLNPAWKGTGHKLGNELVNPVEDNRVTTANGRTAPCRTPSEPEPQGHPTPPTDEGSQKGRLPRKNVINLPPEPPEGSPGHVIIMLRTPQGRLHQRRFHQADHIQVLFDYMMTIGYHQKLYTLLTAYPLRSLHDVKGETLEEAGITGRVKLNVDRLDPD